MYGARATKMFALKSFLFIHPIMANFFQLFITIFVFGHMIRICERQYSNFLLCLDQLDMSN